MGFFDFLKKSANRVTEFTKRSVPGLLSGFVKVVTIGRQVLKVGANILKVVKTLKSIPILAEFVKDYVDPKIKDYNEASEDSNIKKARNLAQGISDASDIVDSGLKLERLYKNLSIK